jgi:hypothetical protein
MPAALHDSAMVYDDDQVGIADSGQAVRNHDAGAAFHRSIKCLLDCDFRL